MAAVSYLIADLTGGAASLVAVVVLPPAPDGAGPVAKRRDSITPFDDWTLMMDDEAVLELYVLRKTR